MFWNFYQKQRIIKGYSQQEIATHLGIKRQAISRWETDKAYPDIDNLVELSKYYEVSIGSVAKFSAKFKVKRI